VRRGGNEEEVVADAEEAITVATELGGPGHQNVKCGFKEACEAAFALNDLTKVDTLLGFVDGLRPGERPRYLGAQAGRFRARLAAASGDVSAVEPSFEEAEQIFRQVGMVFWLAVTQSEHAEWLRSSGGSPKAESLASEARRVFERLRATAWLDRLNGTLVTTDATAVVSVI
jgi:hypothetical protein